jgi:hypothetical protein
MLSKCLNPHCSESFQYLGRGRLFRINFSDAGRKGGPAGKQTVARIRMKTYPIEHFWLCESCSTTMTVELSDAGEICLIPLKVVGPKPTSVASAQEEKRRKAVAS